MRTAISIPDPLFRSADRLARKLKLSRSGLYAAAVERFLQDHDDAAITSRINEVLAHQPSALAPELQSIQSRSVARDSWK